MAVLAECPICRKKQSVRNRKCNCGENLDTAKRSRRVRYWIDFRLPSGKSRREPVGFSAEEARTADGKRKTQKKEGRIFDMVPEAKITFVELTEWYLGLAKVRQLAYFDVLKIYLASFNKEFGNRQVGSLKPLDLENYQIRRQAAGKSDSYIDQETGAARGMLNKAWDNDMVGGDVLKPFKKIEKLLKKNSNARDRILSKNELDRLCGHLPQHARAVVIAGYYTGMRKGELLGLTWDRVDLKRRRIELEARHTKDKEKRYVPMADGLLKTVLELPRADHTDRVFLYKGEPIKNGIRASIRKGCKAAGIPYGRNVKNGFTFHDLRHTFNTNMRRAGVHETVIMEITGHSTREMFDRYNTVGDDEKVDAVKLMESFLVGKK